MQQHDFYTLKGYDRKSPQELSASMEDYLEMICRQSEQEGYIRIHQLADQLHVQPSSASKMTSKLREYGFVSFERYGMIRPTEKGWKYGNYLLHRHDLLSRFFCLLNHSADETEQVERVEHFLSQKTIKNLEQLVIRLEQDAGLK